MTRNVWVVVPAFNEHETIEDVVASLRNASYANVCVVDDGSADDTSELAHRAGAFVLRHIVNLGQGAAIQTGVTYALAQGAEFICTFDADGQHSPDSIAALLGALEANQADVALGSRFLGESLSMPTVRRLLLKAALIFTRMHARINVSDTHNGLRAFTRRAATLIEIRQPGMAHASEILAQISNAKLKFVEVPVTIKYTEYSRRKGQSGFESVKILLDLLYQSIALKH